MKLAGRRHVRFAAQIRHTGRRSGRHYVTPASARLAGDTFVIPVERALFRMLGIGQFLPLQRAA